MMSDVAKICIGIEHIPEHSGQPSHIPGHRHFVDHLESYELHQSLHSATTARAVASRTQAKQRKARVNDLVF